MVFLADIKVYLSQGHGKNYSYIGGRNIYSFRTNGIKLFLKTYNYNFDIETNNLFSKDRLITKLEHKDKEVSKKIRSVFQVSYAVEAKLLGATDFPPLKRPLEDFLECENQFFGHIVNNQLQGVMEIDHTETRTLIRSLVVDPKFFRKGIASSFMEFVLNSFDASLFVVETGVDNGPASELYRKFGFVEVEQWDTDHGVRKVKFEKRIRIEISEDS